MILKVPNFILHFRPKCFIITEEVCEPKQERKCQPAYEEQCQQLTKKNGKCSTAYKDVPYQDNVCNDEYVQECPQVWEERYGTKVWVPDTKNCVNLVSMENKTLLSEFPTLCPKVIKHLILQKFSFRKKPIAKLLQNTGRKSIKNAKICNTVNVTQFQHTKTSANL